MGNPTLVVRQLSRTPSQGPEDTIEFKTGVNLLVGPPNTGKTKWLIMLDYLLGDEGDPADKFEELYEKYDSVKAICTIGDTEYTIERRWRERGLKTKAIVDGVSISTDDLHQLFISKLGMTPFRFPQGNPYSSRPWPTLGWRGLVRQLYRRQKFWTDLADQQHESEQHACLLQFLGLGEKIFSNEYADLVKQENRIKALETERDQFLTTLDKVTRDIIDVKELGVALTPQSLEDAIERLKKEIEANAKLRRDTLNTAVNAFEATGAEKDIGRVDRLGVELSQLRARQDDVQLIVIKTKERLEELTNQQGLLNEELARLGRAETASRLLPKLRITHCPACDQAISEPEEPSPNCFLCKRPQPPAGNSDEFKRRVEFEKQQIGGELSETSDLIKDLNKQLIHLHKTTVETRDRIRAIEADLQPVRTAIAAAMPAEVTLLDIENGRLQERLTQLGRVQSTLKTREEVADQIKQIQAEVDSLEKQVKTRKVDIDFEEASTRLQDGIGTYLNRISHSNPGSWTQTAPIKVSIRERDFSIKVGKANWKTKLGGTQSLLFLLAYHYALFTLTPIEGCHYPGFAAIDFPAKLEDGSSGFGKDQENFVVTPFIRLLSSPGMEQAQLIVAGNAFDGLAEAHRVELTTIWSEVD